MPFLSKKSYIKCVCGVRQGKGITKKRSSVNKGDENE
jgi:hypothetical protein